MGFSPRVDGLGFRVPSLGGGGVGLRVFPIHRMVKIVRLVTIVIIVVAVIIAIIVITVIDIVVIIRIMIE